ncbi:A/G-specific adenine glycosylase [Gloeothece citriformis]|uniref:A/G-specific adenine glycosylase n=1 Tax=Gloeothece citriformis TaxID=2546356 RepID=UPI001EEFFBFF|nr:A/G-specific adenine glycosylase [Gloeothece citriformis]
MEEKRLSALVDGKLKAYLRKKLRKWGERNFRDFPWRHTRDPYAILIAEILLQRTSARTVAPVYLEFLRRYPTLMTLSQAREHELSDLMRPLGLRSRAANLKRLAITAIALYGGELPDSEEELLKLPGVGKYTARAVCANAYGHPLAVLDVNVARILRRFFGFDGTKIERRDAFLWSVAQAVALKRETDRWNLTLIDFGAEVCRATKPNCRDCPLRGKCQFSLNLLGN